MRRAMETKTEIRELTTERLPPALENATTTAVELSENDRKTLAAVLAAQLAAVQKT
jgi:hypothetical protein